MSDTVFVQGQGGAILEMDIPTEGHALERWNEKLDKGELVILPHAVWVDRGDGTKYLVVPDAEDTDDTTAKAGRKAGRKAVEVTDPGFSSEDQV